MGFSKYAVLIFPALVLVAAYWLYGKSIYRAATKWVLWALSALCIGAGGVVLLDGDSGPMPVLGTLVLWVFAGYAVKVGWALRKRS